MRGISSVFYDLLASLEGLCSVELVRGNCYHSLFFLLTFTGGRLVIRWNIGKVVQLGIKTDEFCLPVFSCIQFCRKLALTEITYFHIDIKVKVHNKAKAELKHICNQALEGGGRSAPRFGRFTPRKDRVTVLQLWGWSGGGRCVNFRVHYTTQSLLSPQMFACPPRVYCYYPTVVFISGFCDICLSVGSKFGTHTDTHWRSRMASRFEVASTRWFKYDRDKL